MKRLVAAASFAVFAGSVLAQAIVPIDAVVVPAVPVAVVPVVVVTDDNASAGPSATRPPPYTNGVWAYDHNFIAPAP
jgi:hypothetical protein